MVESMAKLQHPPGRGRGRPTKLLASLAAWAVVASLVCLHRCGRAVQNCETATQTQEQHAAEGGRAAAALPADPHGSLAGLAQQQQPGPDPWPSLRGLSQEAIEGLIRAPAGLYGRVEKGGLPANWM